MIYVRDIIDKFNGTLICGDLNLVLDNFSKDTRTIKEGDVYIGIKGENFDGNLFFRDAFDKGAKACILDNIEIKDIKKYLETNITMSYNDVSPDLVIVIDALACNSLNRICSSIQFGESINPGSGIYNNRKELSKDTLGCEVIAIGVPTVVDLSTIIDINNSYFVTPNHIDLAMDILSGIIAKGINKTFI